MRKLSKEELLGILKNYNFKELHIHHTWKPTHLSFTGSNHLALNMGMKRFHMNVNGWSDIGQHLTLYPDGIFMTGRAFDIQPASISGRNGSKYKPLMLEMIGNFDTEGTGYKNNMGYDKLESEQRESLLALVKYFVENKGENSIVFHRDHSSKTCPGTSVKKSDLIKEIVHETKPTRSLIRLGDRGNNVRLLQHDLNLLGFSLGKADGIAGDKTDKAIKDFQAYSKLKIDGIFGPASYKVLDKMLKTLNQDRKSESWFDGDTLVIKTTPDNVEPKVIGDTLQGANEYGINWQFFPRGANIDLKDPKNIWGIMTNDGNPLGGNSMLVNYQGDRRGAMIFFEDGTLGYKKVKSINEYWKPHIWSASGFTILPYMDFKGEGMGPGVNYKTRHSFVGYDAEGYIYMLVKPNCYMQDILPLAKKLKLVRLMGGDGGGSGQGRSPEHSISSTRKVGTILALKEV